MTKRFLILLLLSALSATAQVQDFAYTTNGGTITITKYTGTNTIATIPDTIAGLPVTGIGQRAFHRCTNLTSVTIGNNVTNLEFRAFGSCHNLTNLTLGNSVSCIREQAFYKCSSLVNVNIPNSVTTIGQGAFAFCTSLISITIGNGVTNIGYSALSAPIEGTFSDCYSLQAVYFKGNAPRLDSSAFSDFSRATIYYLPGTKGWSPAFGGRPTAVWRPWSVSKGLKGFVQ